MTTTRCVPGSYAQADGEVPTFVLVHGIGVSSKYRAAGNPPDCSGSGDPPRPARFWRCRSRNVAGYSRAAAVARSRLTNSASLAAPHWHPRARRWLSSLPSSRHASVAQSSWSDLYDANDRRDNRRVLADFARSSIHVYSVPALKALQGYVKAFSALGRRRLSSDGQLPDRVQNRTPVWSPRHPFRGRNDRLCPQPQADRLAAAATRAEVTTVVVDGASTRSSSTIAADVVRWFRR